MPNKKSVKSSMINSKYLDLVIGYIALKTRGRKSFKELLIKLFNPGQKMMTTIKLLSQSNLWQQNGWVTVGFSQMSTSLVVVYSQQLVFQLIYSHPYSLRVEHWAGSQIWKSNGKVATVSTAQLRFIRAKHTAHIQILLRGIDYISHCRSLSSDHWPIMYS